MTVQSAATVEPSAQASGRPRSGPRTRPWAWALLAVLLGGVVVGRVHGRIEEHELRQPLQAVERAAGAAHKPIRVVSPALASRWTGGSGGADEPSELRVQSLTEPGNAYLEALYYYYSSRHGPADSAPPSGARCYYFAAQPGRSFHSARVSALFRLCYADGSTGPYGTGWVAVQ